MLIVVERGVMVRRVRLDGVVLDDLPLLNQLVKVILFVFHDQIL